MSASQAEGRGFESLRPLHTSLIVVLVFCQNAPFYARRLVSQHGVEYSPYRNKTKGNGEDQEISVSACRTAPQVEKGHRPGEHVYSAVGQTDAGRYLIAFFVYKRNRRALVLSVRDMTRGERRKYERR